MKERKIAKKLSAKKSKAARGGKKIILSIRYTTPEEAKKSHEPNWHLGDS